MCRSLVQLVSVAALVLGLAACDDFSHDSIVNTPPPNYVNLLMTKTVSGLMDDTWRDMVDRPDNGFTMVGATTSLGKGPSAVYVTSVNADREVIWSKPIGGYGFDYGEAVLLTGDGRLLVTGGTSSYSLVTQQQVDPRLDPDFSLSDQNLFMSLLDMDGGIVWERVAGSEETRERATSAVNIQNGFMIAGVVGEPEGNQEFTLLEITTDGEFGWRKSCTPTGAGLQARFVTLADGTFVLAGHGRFGTAGFRDAMVWKVDGAGNIAWQRSFGRPDSEEKLVAFATPDDGLVGCGTADLYYGTDSSQTRLYLLKIDLEGQLLWENTYTQTAINEGRAIVERDDGNFVVCGQNTATGSIHAALISPEGQLIWSDGLGVVGEAMDMTRIDRGYAVIGTVLQEGTTDRHDGLIVEFVEDLSHIE